jgi:LuxR family maltose regulon positive regulatory protein
MSRMARNTPRIDGTRLLVEPRSIEINSPAWFEWLETNSSFIFESEDKALGLSARREQRSGSWYWYAYRRKNGKLRSAYLGRSEEINLDHLREIALTLDKSLNGATPGGTTPAFNKAAMLPPPEIVPASPLLVTKLFVPRPRPDLVVRPRLLTWLHQNSGRRLILISASAGFGKTSILAQWLAGWLNVTPTGAPAGATSGATSGASGGATTRKVAWLSLDERDSDPTRFLTYLIAALQTVQPGLGEKSRVLLQSLKVPSFEAVLGELVNELSRLPASDLMVVLDDYHLVTNEAVHQALAFLLDYAPAYLHIVITSRADPPLPLGRLRARGQLAELRTADLRFTLGEATELLESTLGVSLTPAEIGALEESTEGWAAGLQLAILSMQGRSDSEDFLKGFDGKHRFVLEYLAEEVLRRQPAEVQSFLVQSSILDRLCGSLCDAITGRDDGVAMLERLEQANLFLVPLDKERRWFRYHHLFADFLKQRQPSDVTTWHHRASQWFERQGQIEEAIDHALAAKDNERAAFLVDGVARHILMRGELHTLRGWLYRLDRAVLATRPRLYIYRAWTLAIGGRVVEAEQDLAEAEKALKTGDNKVTEIAAIRALIAAYQGNLTQLEGFSRQALENLAGDDPFIQSIVTWSGAFPHLLTGKVENSIQAFTEAERVARQAGNMLVSMSALCQLAELQMLKGNLKEGARIYEDAVQLSQQDNPEEPLASAGMAYLGLGEIYREWGQLDRATDYLYRGIELSRRWGDLTSMDGYLSLAKINSSRNKPQEALAFLQKVVDLTSRMNSLLVIDYIKSLRTRFWLRHGPLEAVIEWSHQTTLDPTAFFFYNWLIYTNFIRLRIIQKDFAGAAQLLAVLAGLIEKYGGKRNLIEQLILEALLFQAQHKNREALAKLRESLLLAEPEGYISLFADEGPALVALLKNFQTSTPGRQADSLQPYVARILQYVAQVSQVSQVRDTPSLPAVNPAPTSALNLLSEGEQRVLRLLAAGLSNAAIARELVLEVSTVKTHLLHIYTKLDVHDRHAAITQARSLNLL